MGKLKIQFKKGNFFMTGRKVINYSDFTSESIMFLLHFETFCVTYRLKTVITCYFITKITTCMHMP